MEKPNRTVLYEKHLHLKATMINFGGWEMPLQYPTGIIKEHLAVRSQAGIFDVSHMGRILFSGKDALPFLQHVLTNNAAALYPGTAQYTIIANENGGAIDDAYLYRFSHNEYILVINAGNRKKDLDYLKEMAGKFENTGMKDISEELAMISLQGPMSESILRKIVEGGSIPEPSKNNLGKAIILGSEALVSRTGYTGEPLGCEIFIPAESACAAWDALMEKGASPIGLGARDTLRLEAGLPLYGHELGNDPEGREIPVFSCPLSRFGVSFHPLKGNFVGRQALMKQSEALKKIREKDYSLISGLPSIIMPITLTERGVARAGFKVYSGEKQTGYVTSGTTVPYYNFTGEGILSKPTLDKGLRSIGMAILDSRMRVNDTIEVEIRGERVKGIIVPFHLRSEASPYARPILRTSAPKLKPGATEAKKADKREYLRRAEVLLSKAMENTSWRQRECINLIPSEQTQSPATRLLSVMDPAFRYAEHKGMKAFYNTEVFYYQGVDFIKEVEELLEKELSAFLGCREVESRLISGQMANMTVFSAVLDYVNRLDRKAEPRRIRCVMNNLVAHGGHISAQSMGGLHDFVARDPVTERPNIIGFPVLKDNMYMIDVEETKKLIASNKPELVIFGKSMVLHPEPVKEIKSFILQNSLDTVVMYDMAHVLGLAGPLFQEPFKDGADIVTGSTHKTFFGTQRGMAATDHREKDGLHKLWKAVRRRAFPGHLSNHHLGTMLGLLMASYEMNYFKEEYQKNVLANAKAFALALKDSGMNVAGDPTVSYTETHQVVVNVGYGRGPEIARRLEENNIIVNYQATPEGEGFTAAGSLRLGVAEMTRFGMGREDFRTIAQFIRDVAIGGHTVRENVRSFRKDFLELRYCFTGKEIESSIGKLHRLIY